MRHILFGKNASSATTAILIKDSSFISTNLTTHYIGYLANQGISLDSCIAFTLEYASSKKPTASQKKQYLSQLLPVLDQLGVHTLYVVDSEYFKTLTKNVKADHHIGYVLDCAIEGYTHMKVILGVNYQALVYNPTLGIKLKLSLDTLISHAQGTYVDPGSHIIKYEVYPQSLQDIEATLRELHKYPKLTVDIEGFALKFYKCGIGTIAFAWNEHEGVGIACDYKPCDPTEIEVWDDKDSKFKTRLVYGEHVNNPEVKALLKRFFTEYKGTCVYHNGNFDMKVLIYELWMKDLGDYVGMFAGINVLASKFDDTKIIAYLATNNAVKNDLKLKNLAQTFAGNWAQDNDSIKDIRTIPLGKLLQYNLVDCLSTWWVYNKYTPIMIQDQQEDLYKGLFKDSVRILLQIELVGMPIDPNKVKRARNTLEAIVKEHNAYLQASPIIQDYHYGRLMDRVASDNEKLKKKVRTLEEFAHVKFNPGSDQQLQGLIYDYLGYPVIDTTNSGAPAVGASTLGKLIHQAKTEEHKQIFEHLIGLAKADKVLTSFIPAFEQAQQLPDGSWRLYGNFNLGGTQSGRLSSSSPNMQNIPAGSTYAHIIKQCFVSLPDWVFCGADFSALEAMVGALLPMDPNKLKIYTDGYDSHCLHAFAYFAPQMPDITDSVKSINSIKKKYKSLRSKSKAPTFA